MPVRVGGGVSPAARKEGQFIPLFFFAFLSQISDLSSVLRDSLCLMIYIITYFTFPRSGDDASDGIFGRSGFVLGHAVLIYY